jgi:hypothetical protein
MITIRWRLFSTFSVMIAIFIASAPTNAQDTKSDFLRVRAKAQTIQAPPKNDSKLRWVILDVANLEVHVQDADLEKDIREALTKMAEEKHSWIATDTGFNFRGQLLERVKRMIAPGSFDISSEIKRPTENAEAEFIWKITYVPPSVVSLQIVISTVEAQKPALTESKTIGDAAAAFDIGALTDEEKQIPVTLKYIESDVTTTVSGTSSDAKKTIETELLKVAAYSYLAARAGGIVIGKKMSQPVSVIEDQIKDNYSTAKIQGWQSPVAGIKQQGVGTGIWILSVEKTRLVGAVRIDVEKVDKQKQLEKENLTKPTQDNQTQIDSLEKKRGKIEREYNTKYGPRLLSPPEVPTRSQIEKALSLLAQVSDVASVTAKADGPTLAFDVTRRPKIANLSFKGGFGYSPEDSFTGLAQVSESNLLSLGETFSLSFTGGNDVLRGNIAFSYFYEEPRKKQYFRSFSLNGKFFRDRNQRLGNTQGPKLEDMESSGEARFSTGYDSFTPKNYILRAEGVDKTRKRVRYGVKVDAGFDYKNVSIQPRTPATTPVAEGQVAALTLVLDQGLSFDLKKTARSHVGQFDAFLTTTAKRAFDFLGADFQFDQFTIDAGGQLFFGIASPTDMLLRFSSKLGVSSSGIPIFEQFRLGGPNNVRGLEEGEFIGRNMNFERAEFGFKSTYLFSLFKHRSDKGEAAKPATVGGIDLSNTYLKTFYDWGRVTDRTSFADLFKFASGVQGIGIAIELRGLNVGSKRASLTIGYAYSHDSLLHKSGVLVTGLSVDR